MTLFTVFSGVALLLAVVGIYGVMALFSLPACGGDRDPHGAGCPDRERAAAGLCPGRSIDRFGMGAGLVGALVLTRFLETLLFNLSTTIRSPSSRP